MLDYIKKVERMIIWAILIMMLVLLVFSTVRLGWVLVGDIVAQPFLQISSKGLLGVFGLFTLILIGIELLEILKEYIQGNVFHVEVIFILALIAVARKIIILDINALRWETLVGIGFILLALSVSYFLVMGRRAKKVQRPPTAAEK